MKRKLLSLAAVAACAFAGSAQAQISDGIVKIGVLNDMSGLYSDITGPGSVTAARMAVEDYIKASGTVLRCSGVSSDNS
jgi:branched-chain amino acid transport system substrate-binding protein